MNPSATNGQAGFNLPPPHTELPPLPPDFGSAPGRPEATPSTPEISPLPSQAAAFASAPPPPSFATNAAGHGTTSDVPVTTNTVAATTADDEDLIEKEWIYKAKAIVEKTRNDPHQQSRELNMLRAGYLQKRYNRNIKLST